MKTKKTPKTNFTAREVTVILEDIRSQFRAFGEGLKALSTKVDGIAANQARTLEKVTALEIGQRLLIKRVEALEKRV
ncbi:MAG: hypothetical protein KKB76_07735, partial [Candidatus Omnitrophica bacterium]|nr:hypothetical protein [Candidatus Omnitrophota bacterium]